MAMRQESIFCNVSRYGGECKKKTEKNRKKMSDTWQVSAKSSSITRRLLSLVSELIVTSRRLLKTSHMNSPRIRNKRLIPPRCLPRMVNYLPGAGILDQGEDQTPLYTGQVGLLCRRDFHHLAWEHWSTRFLSLSRSLVHADTHRHLNGPWEGPGCLVE